MGTYPLIWIYRKRGRKKPTKKSVAKPYSETIDCQFQPYVVFLRGPMACVWICSSWERDSCRLKLVSDLCDDRQEESGGGAVLRFSITVNNHQHIPFWVFSDLTFLFLLSGAIKKNNKELLFSKTGVKSALQQQNRKAWRCANCVKNRAEVKDKSCPLIKA